MIPKTVLPKRVQPKKKKLSVLASLLFHDPDAPDFLRKSISDAGKTFYVREVGVMHYYIIAKKAEKSILINFRRQGLVPSANVYLNYFFL